MTGSTDDMIPIDSDIQLVTIEDEMERSYLDYAMSVIVSRALPDVRDGLKPVHRRILYAMKDGGFDSSKPYKKSARIVGDVMGKYHPHGDQAIYGAMVRMAQDFSMRLPLIDGQGNFGSMDGDPAAAMRYTEARLDKAAEELLADYDKDTVDFRANYDETISEPVVLPSRVPNLLVNGAGGIAVGMATNIPPHNLGEVIDACCAYIDNSSISIDELMEYVLGPDFPTGGIILGRTGIRNAFHEGRGSIVMRGKAEIEEIRKDRTGIVITEIPYQVNKAQMIERIAEVVKQKTIEGISDIRDESDKDGVRVVVELKREAVPDVVLAQLYKFTPLQTSFGVNCLALDHGQPRMMTLYDIVRCFIQFREEVVTRRTKFELNKAREKAHLLVGLAVSVANIDEIVELIKKAQDPQVAREQLMAKPWPAKDVAPLIALVDEPGRAVDAGGNYHLSEAQARAILELRLHRLTGLERDKIGDELREITDHIQFCLAVLASREKLMEIVKTELIEVKDKFNTPRRTQIENSEHESDLEDLIQKEDMVVTVSNTGYIKRVPLSTYRSQRRGGKGRSGMNMKEEDFISKLFVANTHTPVLFFSTDGLAYKMKVYRLPLGNPQARGKALVNLLPINAGQTISTVMPLPEDEKAWDELTIIFVTKSGDVRRNKLSDFTNVKSNGKIAMKLEENDRLIGVATGNAKNDLLISTKLGKCIRFSFDDVRVFTGRTSTGVRGIRLAPGDEVMSMCVLKHTTATTEERSLYVKQANALRRHPDDVEDGSATAADEEGAETVVTGDIQLSEERFAELAASEEFLLTVSDTGFGKRTSSYEYRITGRGGQGIRNLGGMGEKNNAVVASFPVRDDQQLILVTNGGQLIRLPVHDIRICGRSAMGVKLFTVTNGDTVVSVEPIDVDQTDGDEDDVSAEDQVVETNLE